MVQKAKTDRDAVLQSAAGLLAHHGLGGVSIRAVAGALGLAPNAIYYYFDSLDSLLNAVAARVCAMLHASLEEACKGQPPLRGIRRLAEAYLDFARDQHYLYEALLLPRPPGGEDSVAPERVWFFVVAQVQRVSGAKAAPEAAVALWAALHGLASLQSTKAFNQEKPRHSIDFALDAWIVAAQAAHRHEQRSASQDRSLAEVLR